MSQDNRLSPRLAVDDVVEVNVRGTFWEFIAVDVSDTGIGLEPVAADVLTVGDRVIVVLPNQDEIPADVLESSDYRVRLRFRPTGDSVVEVFKR